MVRNVKINSERLRLLREAIKHRAIIKNKGVGKGGRNVKWIFDLRLTLLDSKENILVTEIMAEMIETLASEDDYCIGCLTIAGDPLIGSLVFYFGKEKGKKVKGFIVRKQKKAYGLQKSIEGSLHPKEHVILIDDLINTGNSLKKAVEIIEQHGGCVKEIFVIVDFRKGSPRKFYDVRKIKIHSIFDLDDFGLKLSNYNWNPKMIKDGIKNPYGIIKSLNVKEEPFFRSAPAVKDDLLYVGSDSGSLCCIDIQRGRKAWEFPTPATRKGILSSPLILGNNVLFGDYNGILYSLKRKGGSVFWKSKICDFIGSSPVSDSKGKLVFIGTEYGNRDNQLGGVSCVDASTGKIKWAMRDIMYVHCTPEYSLKNRAVFFGSNSGSVYSLDSHTGRKNWERKTIGGVHGEVKMKIVKSPDESRIYFGSLDGNIYCMRAANGMPLWMFRTGGEVKFIPVVTEKLVLCGSDDSYFYCLDSRSGESRWKVKVEGQLIGGAACYKGMIFFGDTEGIIYVVDINNGKVINWVETDDRFYSTPRIYGKKMFIGNRILQCWNISELMR